MRDLAIDDRVTIPRADLSWRAVRASGPGGQNVNKVASKVELRFDLEGTAALSPAVKARLRVAHARRLDADGKLLLSVQETRDQGQNLARALERLAEMIRRSLVAPKKRRATKPTRGSKERRLSDKRIVSLKKQARRGAALD